MQEVKIGRFASGDLMALLVVDRDSPSVRVTENEVQICLYEFLIKLINDVYDAVNLWNMSRRTSSNFFDN